MSTLPDPAHDLALGELTTYFWRAGWIDHLVVVTALWTVQSFPVVLCVTAVPAAPGLLSQHGQGLFVLPAGSTQTRHIPEDTPNGFHLQSVSKLLLIISCV